MIIHVVPLLLLGCRLFFAWQISIFLYAFFFMPSLEMAFDEVKTWIFLTIMAVVWPMLAAPTWVGHLLGQIQLSLW